MIISSKDKKKGDKDKVDEDTRRKKFMKIFGSAKYPDFPMTKYDTYDQ